jgi:hypothetical protein
MIQILYHLLNTMSIVDIHIKHDMLLTVSKTVHPFPIGDNMARINFDEYRRTRTEEQMHEFFEHESKFRESVAMGGSFIDVHEHQIRAANVIHEVDEMGCLHIAKEIYPHEAETIREYLEIYDEIQSGVRI